MRLREKKEQKKNTAPHPMGCGLPSGDVCVPAALRAEGEPHPECHSGGGALHAAAEDLHESNVEIRELGEVEIAPCSARLKCSAVLPRVR